MFIPIVLGLLELLRSGDTHLAKVRCFMLIGQKRTTGRLANGISAVRTIST